MIEDTARNQTSQTVGELLRAARENMKLSQEELASLLHLRINIIQALENNQFDQLAAPTYVKGYIRSFARHVELDGDELIQLYETGTSASSSPEILPQVSKHTQFSSTDKPVKIMTYLISLGLVLLLLIWWQGEFIVNSDGNLSGSNALSADGPYPGGFDYSYDIVIHPDDPFYRAPPMGDMDTGSDGLVNELPDYSEPFLNIDNHVDSLSSTTGIESGAADSPISDSILMIEVNQDSWIEVRDSNKAKLYLNLAKPGETISIEGETPLSVVLGNAEGVKVTWKGKPFDVKPYSSAGVARFKLED